MPPVVINSFEMDRPAPEWVPLAQVGYWLGHPSGPYQVTTEHIAAMEEEFADNFVANGKELVIDWQHESLRSTKGEGAAAWVDRVQRRANGTQLWGHVSQWLPGAAQALQEKRYRYLSPVYLFGQKDRVTGRTRAAQLHSAALTNTPFITELPALVNSLLAGGSTTPVEEDEEMSKPTMKSGIVVALLATLASLLNGARPPAVANALGVQPDAAPRDWLAALLSQLTDPAAPLPEPVANALGVGPDTEASQFLDALVAKLATPPAVVERLPQALANTLGVPADARPEEVQARLVSLQAAADLQPIANQLGIVATDTASILAAIGSMQTERAAERAEKLVANAMTDGRIPPANKDFWLQFAANNPAQAESVIGALPRLVAPPSHAANSLPPAGTAAVTEEQKEVARQLGLTPEELAAEQAG